jgi:hypothetical protein
MSAFIGSGREPSGKRVERDRLAAVPFFAAIHAPEHNLQIISSARQAVDSTLGAFGWSFVKPIPKLYHNVTITFASVPRFTSSGRDPLGCWCKHPIYKDTKANKGSNVHAHSKKAAKISCSRDSTYE